ncbi:MAG: S8 family peptidase [Gemmatimonadaceae bacterium]|nr:S8 family peptidase [Gemmatimonadaceae bacterium]
MQTSSPRRLPGRYLVVIKEGLEDESALRARDQAVSRVHGRIFQKFSKFFKGFAADMTSDEIDLLSADPRVSRVIADEKLDLYDVDLNAGWGLGRIDQRNGPSDNQFTYSLVGQSNVNIYIIDTGIKGTHPDFTGRLYTGWTFDPGSPALDDCVGHGTSTASAAAGSEYGVAKGAKIWSVRVTGCDRQPSRSDVIAGLEWVASYHIKPAVANISFGMSAFLDGVLPGSVHDAAQKLRNAGVFVTVAAGNEATDACNSSPANVVELMTVGATDANDARTYFSNFGECVDIYAPGDGAPQASYQGGYNYPSGTSISAPMVAGVAALVFAKYPNDTNDEVHFAIRDGATTGLVGNIGDLFLYSKLPAPVQVAINGPHSVPSGAICTWSSSIKAGRRPFTISWSGVLDGSTVSITGSPAASGNLFLSVTDALGNTAVADWGVYVDPTSSAFICP